ncbi:MAG: hypothetical protein ABR511_02375 [Acidimicrobiales bacterium]
MVGAVAGVATAAAYLVGTGRSLDFDGAETVGRFVREGPPWAVFSRQAVFNNHPFFSFLEQLVRVATGRTDAAAMRALPIAFGALTVGLLAWYAARRHGPLAGLVGAGVVACNPTFAALARAPRGYSLLALCALGSTILVVEDHDGRSGWWDLAYVVVAGAGLATHLYMVPVLAGHVGVAVARRRLGPRGRGRLLGVALLGSLAYAGMARAMVDAGAAHARVFQPGFPWRVWVMAAGGGWAAVALSPVVVTGGAVVVRSRAARGAAVAAGAVLVALWAGVQSAALSERFLVWLVPAAGYLAAAAVGRAPRRGLLAGAGVVLAAAALAPGFTTEPTGYRQAAALVQRVDASGRRACVVGVGVSPMLAYLDTPRQFAVVTEADQLAACDTVVVATWWPSSSAWFAADARVIRVAEATFPVRRVLPAADPALVLSRPPG